MNPVLKYIIEVGINYEKTPAGCIARDAALDEMYVKLIVRPIQKLWIQYRHKFRALNISNHNLKI